MTPDDFHALFAESRDGEPFANGTEGYGWMAANCDRCIHDQPARQGDETNGCPLILVALMGRTPRQWLDGPRDENGLYAIATQYTCVQFCGEDDGPDPEPHPHTARPGRVIPTRAFRGRAHAHQLPRKRGDMHKPTDDELSYEF